MVMENGTDDSIVVLYGLPLYGFGYILIVVRATAVRLRLCPTPCNTYSYGVTALM